jgi:kynurenine 3-monooxygenase
MRPQPVTIVGCGLAGALLATMLARRDFPVTLYERRDDPRRARVEAGRSINLALAARGIRPLEQCGVLAQVQPHLVPMRGRLLHEISGAQVLQPYGQRPNEVIQSVGRAALNQVLAEAAEQAGALLRFGQRCLGFDASMDHLQFIEEHSARSYQVDCGTVIGTDGAGSVVRSSLAAAEVLNVRVERLDHDYKEMTIPDVAGGYALEPNALHIWPRGGFMLIALPNADGSFTVTLFLSHSGDRSFSALGSEPAARHFFTEQFPDLQPHLVDLLADFARNPQGQLATVYASGWHLGGKVLLLGDAAHAIVPFHGQGMNAAFEDCAAFDALLDQFDSWEDLFREFERLRRPNAEAIARMALENYIEMRDTVRDPKFKRLKDLSFDLEKRFPCNFIPRYSMVMFHPEIPYAEAQLRGRLQDSILEELDGKRSASGGVDMTLADALIRDRLPAMAIDIKMLA